MHILAIHEVLTEMYSLSCLISPCYQTYLVHHCTYCFKEKHVYRHCSEMEKEKLVKNRSIVHGYVVLVFTNVALKMKIKESFFVYGPYFSIYKRILRHCENAVRVRIFCVTKPI